MVRLRLTAASILFISSEACSQPCVASVADLAVIASLRKDVLWNLALNVPRTFWSLSPLLAPSRFQFAFEGGNRLGCLLVRTLIQQRLLI